MATILRPANTRAVRFTTLILATTIFAFGAANAAERVYKWTDADGVVHFSASPPPNQETEQIKLKAAPPVTKTEETKETAPQGELFAESQQPDNSAIEEKNREAQCQRGRNMIAQIEPRPRVFRIEEDGSRTYLADEERLTLLAEAKELVAEHCDS